MQLCLLHTLLLLFSLPQTWALHEGDVGIIDWYKPLIGVPLVGALETAPRFLQRVAGRNESSGFVLTATSSNVLAALHSGNGSLAWRFLFDQEDKINGVYGDADVVTTLSGRGGTTLRSFQASTGHLLNERRLHSQANGVAFQPPHFGSAVTYAAGDTSDGPRDLFVLSNGRTVTHIDGTTGKPKWSWTAPDQSSLVVYNRIISTSDTVYTIGVSKSFASYTLHITSLLPSTGKVLSDIEVPSSIAQPPLDTILLALQAPPPPPHEYTPRIAWLEDGQIKSKALTPDLESPVNRVKDLAFDRIMDVGVSDDRGTFVGLRKGVPPRILKMSEDGTAVTLLGELDTVSSKEAIQTAYGGGIDEEGNACVARVYWSKKLDKAVVDLFSASHSQNQRYYFPFDSSSDGSIHHVALTVSPNPQLVISTSTGAVQSWSLLAASQPETIADAELLWTREEGLSAVSVAEFVELPEQALAVALGREGEGFVNRLQRQLVQAQDLPQYLFNFALRYYSTGTTPSAAITRSKTVDNAGLARDPFGFRQLIIAATEFGKVYAIDTSSGEIVWNRALGLGWAGEPGPDGTVVGGRLDVSKIYVIKPVGSGGSQKGKGKQNRKTRKARAGDDEVVKPEVVVIAQRVADNTLVDTVLFHVDAMTGADVREGVPKSERSRGLLQGRDVIQGLMTQGFFLYNETRMAVMLDEFLQVYLYPDNEETRSIFARVAPSLSFPLSATVGDREVGTSKRRIIGHSVELNDNLSDRYVAYQTWTLSLPPDENLQAMVPAVKGPIASLGKVLGNRTTLYKYLNERLFGVLTETATGTCGLYVVDAVKGAIVYRVSLPASTGFDGLGNVCDVKMSLTENWLVYHYYDGDIASGTAGLGQTKGWRIVSVEMYEGLADQKTKSSAMSSHNLGVRNVTLIERAYVFPHGINAMATTSTKFGVTSKDIIVATHNNKIYTIPRRLLDPRRPNRKPTAEEQEEMLIEYDPLISDDPKRVISHTYEVAGTQRIITSPALLESTSLVFAYGLDLFLTRVSPSGTFDVLSESFNKVQLIFTVLGLVIAITITRPMVRQKMLKQKWYWQ